MALAGSKAEDKKNTERLKKIIKIHLKWKSLDLKALESLIKEVRKEGKDQKVRLKVIERLEKVMEDLETELKKLATYIPEKEKMLIKIRGEIIQIEKDVKRFDLKWNKIPKHIIDKLPEGMPRGRSLEECITQLENEITKSQEIVKELEENCQVAETVLASLDGKLKASKHNLETRSAELEGNREILKKKIAKTAFVTLENVAAALIQEDEYEILENEVKKFEEDKNKLSGQLAPLEKELAGQTLPNLDDLTLRKDTANTAFQTAVATHAENKTHLALAETHLAVARTSGEEGKNLEQECNFLMLLSGYVCGTEPPKISLERFFLGHRLDEVLVHASQRMKLLSNNRFVLLKEDKQRDGRAQAGLDLKIFDNFTGTERPIESLSGGQMFLASLSMALGLADVVQSRSGAVKLDALFIDEGFGSLDEETLALALKALNELRYDRMVGIISHVSDLVTQIPNKIEVKELTGGGSMVKVVAER